MQRLREHFWDIDVCEILKIRTSPRNRQDFIGWFPEKNECFSVRSAYRLATGNHATGASSHNPTGVRPIWQCIWSSKVPLKMRITAWKVATGVLATSVCKKYMHLAKHDGCPICGKDAESSFHALIACDHARTLWELMRRVWKLPDQKFLVD